MEKQKHIPEQGDEKVTGIFICRSTKVFGTLTFDMPKDYETEYLSDTSMYYYDLDSSKNKTIPDKNRIIHTRNIRYNKDFHPPSHNDEPREFFGTDVNCEKTFPVLKKNPLTINNRPKYHERTT
jgi:hypothetical protein